MIEVGRHPFAAEASQLCDRMRKRTRWRGSRFDERVANQIRDQPDAERKHRQTGAHSIEDRTAVNRTRARLGRWRGEAHRPRRHADTGRAASEAHRRRPDRASVYESGRASVRRPAPRRIPDPIAAMDERRRSETGAGRMQDHCAIAPTGYPFTAPSERPRMI